MDDVDDSPAPTSLNPNPNPSDRHSPSPSPSLTLALSTQTPAAAGATVGGGGREDCWSEGATTTLIDAWGERHLHLGRGNLKQRHWQEVADAVTARDGRAKNPRTDLQCKNRIDTLKKKYKSERSKIAAASSGHSRPSTWRFFRRLDRLLGGAAAAAGPPPAPTFPPQFPQRLRTRKRYRSPVSVSSGTSDSLPPSPSPPPPPAAAMAAAKGAGEVARAVLRLGEAYERVERTKARLAAEAERRRMEFVRELELQRVRFFVRTQMELSQLREKHRRRRCSMDSNGNGNDDRHCRNGNGGEDGDNVE